MSRVMIFMKTEINEAELLHSLNRIATALEQISAALRFRSLPEDPDSEVSLCQAVDQIAASLENIDQKGLDTYPQN